MNKLNGVLKLFLLSALCVCLALGLASCKAGEKGDKGDAGVGIVSVEKTGTVGLTDTYTITFADGSTTTFTVINGKDGIDGVDGKDGDDGAEGKSAYEIYKEKCGYEGTEEEWLSDLVNGNLATKKTYTVTFKASEPIEVESQQVERGDTVVRPEILSMQDVQLDGWYVDDEKWSFNGNVVTKDITLTARWSWVGKTSEGLVYSLDKDTNTYKVKGYEGTDTEVYIPGVYNGLLVTGIDARALQGNKTVTKIHFPDTVTKIGYASLENCTSLTEVTFGKGSRLDKIESFAFKQSGITKIAVPDLVELIEHASFENCTALTEVTFGEGSKLEKIDNFAFKNTGLTKIAIPDSVKTTGSEAFGNCTSLTEVTFGENSEIEKIGRYSFRNTGLTKLALPDSLMTIEIEAFTSCAALTEVVFGENSVLETIETNAFNNSGLIKIVIPDTLTKIGGSAFASCASLTDVYYLGTSEQFAAISVGAGNEPFTAATVYYYSVFQPETEGSFWQYVDGVPTAW